MKKNLNLLFLPESNWIKWLLHPKEGNKSIGAEG